MGRRACEEVAAPPKLLQAAVGLLARRDFSRAELRARLLRAAGDTADAAGVDRVLDTVQAQGLQSEERFVQEFIRTREARFGPARLRHELLRRGVAEERIEVALKGHLRDEYAAAHALWSKRFKSPPPDAREWARQARFLGARGFSHDVIRKVLAGCKG